MNNSKYWQSSIKGIILDMDGVLWRGSQPIGDLISIFNRIHEIGWKVIFATNNATNTISQYIELLNSYGVKAEEWQIVTSAHAVLYHLTNMFPTGGPVYIIGEHGLIEACAQHDYYQSEENALTVIAGMDRNLTYEKLKIATLLLRKGVPFIGTNPDRTFPTPQGLVPGAGAILAALTTASGKNPIIAGKPEPTMYKIALERLKIPAAEVLVIGDRPETDIAGAQSIGCRTGLVLSGVTDAKLASKWKPKPDLIAENLEELVSMNWSLD